jgi:uncharacterized protein YxjI
VTAADGTKIGEIQKVFGHFDFLRGEETLGTHNRQLFKLRDVYTIDMSGDPGHTIDRRLILANAVGMDALQAR